MRSLAVSGLVALVLGVGVGSVAAQPYYYWPAAPAYPPYYPPLNYGPGNHYPHPFQRWYPEHPYAHLYYPYTYLPYSAYYAYPTLNVYGHSYNPYAPPPGLRVPTFYPGLHGPMPVAPEQLPSPAVAPRPPAEEPKK